MDIYVGKIPETLEGMEDLYGTLLNDFAEIKKYYHDMGKMRKFFWPAWSQDNEEFNRVFINCSEYLAAMISSDPVQKELMEAKERDFESGSKKYVQKTLFHKISRLMHGINSFKKKIERLQKESYR